MSDEGLDGICLFDRLYLNSVKFVEVKDLVKCSTRYCRAQRAARVSRPSCGAKNVNEASLVAYSFQAGWFS
jgi:hypothetical protein